MMLNVRSALFGTRASAAVCRRLYRVTQKNGNFWKTRQKIEEIQEKNLLTETEPLQLAF